MDEKNLLEIINKLRTKGTEWKTVDAKHELSLTCNGEKAEFVKDVIAMANNGEKSYLVIGLQDGTFADVGKLSSHHLKNNLNQLLEGKIDPPVVIDYQEFTVNGNEYGLVEIAGYNLPYIVARDYTANPADRKKTNIFKGTIFVRHEDRTEGVTRAELEELIQMRGIKREFENETEYSRQLVYEHPFAWEYKLTAELLRSKLEPLKQRYKELQRGLVYKKVTPIQDPEFGPWAQSKCYDLANLIKLAVVVIKEEISASWGLPGVPGDPVEIKHAVDKLISVCNDLVEWETDVHFARVSSVVNGFKQKMEGWTRQVFDEIASSPDKLLEPFNQPNPRGIYDVKLVFTEPPGLKDAQAELQRLQHYLRTLQ